MPIKKTTKGGRPAFKFGDKGTAYPYEPGNKQSREKAPRGPDSGWTDVPKGTPRTTAGTPMGIPFLRDFTEEG